METKHSLTKITAMFFRSVSQGKINKNKIKQMRPNQSYRVLHNKGNYKNETNQKKQAKKGENYLQMM